VITIPAEGALPILLDGFYSGKHPTLCHRRSIRTPQDRRLWLFSATSVRAIINYRSLFQGSFQTEAGAGFIIALQN